MKLVRYPAFLSGRKYADGDSDICVLSLLSSTLQVLKVTSWSPFILFSVQCMSVPILYQLNSGSHPKPANRREMITYDEHGVATFRPEQLRPPQDKAVTWYFVLPGIWFTVILFYLYVAISDWSPSFCTISGFYGYKHF